MYDTQHLIAHPYQQVAAMVFLLRAEGLDKNGEETLKEPDRFVYSFAMSFLRRSESRVLRASGDCFGEARANCSVTCDGGGFAVEKSSHGVMVRLSGEGVGLGASTIQRAACSWDPASTIGRSNLSCRRRMPARNSTK